MKCTKAHNLYFASRDGMLDELGRMKLARHLAQCPACALFAKEMEASLDSARSLPELAAPEGFEWNVKRRILQERTKLMRREHVSPFGGRRWLSQFAIGASAAAAAIVLVALFAAQWFGSPSPSIKVVSEAPRTAGTASSVGEGTVMDMTIPGSYTGPRMVSSDFLSLERGSETARQAPFQFVAGSREDSLSKENEMLRMRVQRLERQIVLLKNMLDKERIRQINMSLP